MRIETLRELTDIESQSDEPWYDERRALLPVMVSAAQHIERVLLQENCKFEAFDLGHQLGVAYSNPETGKSRALRVKLVRDGLEMNTAIRSAIRELKEGTAA